MLMDRCGTNLVDLANTPRQSPSLPRAARRTAPAPLPAAAGCTRRCSASATTSRSGDFSGKPRRGRWCGAPPCGLARTSTLPSTCARRSRLVPGWPEHPGGEPQPARAPDPAIAARRGGWGGRDRRAADDNPGFDLIQDRVERPPSSPSAMPPQAPRSAAALRPPLSTAARNSAPRSRQRTLRPTLSGHSRVPETRVRVKLSGLDTITNNMNPGNPASTKGNV